MITLHSRIRPRHEASITGDDLTALPTREIEATAASYDEATAMLDEQVPEGWLKLWISTRPTA